MAVIALIWRLCRTVRGIMTARTTMVNSRMLRPKLLNRRLYNSTRLLIIGPSMTAFHMSPISAKVRALLAYINSQVTGPGAEDRTDP